MSGSPSLPWVEFLEATAVFCVNKNILQPLIMSDMSLQTQLRCAPKIKKMTLLLHLSTVLGQSK